MKFPTPTPYERILEKELRLRGLPVGSEEVIWYTTQHRYTPDLKMGRLLVEVDGGIHDLHRMPDRIRTRALEAMGYRVLRVKNFEIQRDCGLVADRIVQEFYQMDERESLVRIVQVKGSPSQGPHPSEDIVKIWCVQIAMEFADEKMWTADSIVHALEARWAGVTKDQGVMDHVMLLLFGLAMRADETGAKLDTRRSALIFGRFKEIMERQFGKGGAVGMVNMLNISLPNFFKNLLFAGGPKINPGVVEIASQDVFDSIVDEFNNDFRSFGVYVEKSQAYDECCDMLNRLSARTLSPRLSWLPDLCQYRKQRSY